MKPITIPYLKEALLSVAMEEVAVFEALPACPLVTSPQLTKKIEKLARAQKRFTWRFVKTAKRRFVTVLAIILLLATLSLSISSVRDTLFYFVTKKLPAFTNFTPISQSQNNHYESILQYQEPKWLPAGFILINQQSSRISYELDWQKDELTIYYDQYLASSTNFSMDNESDVSFETYINGSLTLVKCRYNTFDFWWINDIYLYHLFCSDAIGWEDAIKIIESIAEV